MTDCDACLSGDHESCVGAGCACFQRTCAEAEARERYEQAITADYVATRHRKGKPIHTPNAFDRLVLRFFGWEP